MRVIKRFIIKTYDHEYVYKINRNNYYTCSIPKYAILDASKAKRYKERLDILGVPYTLIEHTVLHEEELF